MVASPARTRQVEPGENTQGIRQPLISQLIADAAPFRGGRHQPALAQAGQMVGQVSPGSPEVISHLGRITRTVDQVHKHPAAQGISQRSPHTGKRAQVNLN